MMTSKEFIKYTEKILAFRSPELKAVDRAIDQYHAVKADRAAAEAAIVRLSQCILNWFAIKGREDSGEVQSGRNQGIIFVLITEAAQLRGSELLQLVPYKFRPNPNRLRADAPSAGPYPSPAYGDTASAHHYSTASIYDDVGSARISAVGGYGDTVSAHHYSTASGYGDTASAHHYSTASGYGDTASAHHYSTASGYVNSEGGYDRINIHDVLTGSRNEYAALTFSTQEMLWF